MQNILEDINALSEFINIRMIHVSYFKNSAIRWNRSNALLVTTDLPFISVSCKNGVYKLQTSVFTDEDVLEHSHYWGYNIREGELHSKNISRAIHASTHIRKANGLKIYDYTEYARDIIGGKINSKISYAERIDDEIFLYATEDLNEMQIEYDSRSNIFVSL